MGTLDPKKAFRLDIRREEGLFQKMGKQPAQCRLSFYFILLTFLIGLFSRAIYGDEEGLEYHTEAPRRLKSLDFLEKVRAEQEI